MSADAAPPENESLRFSEVLRGLAEADGDSLSMDELIQAFGERAFGALMLTFGLLNTLPWPPGGTTIMGAPLLFITAQLTIGQDRLWLPRWIRCASFSRKNFRSGLARIERSLQRTERLTKPRLCWAITGPAERLIGVICLLLTCVLVLPIPGGNFIPALVIATFAIALVQRDGVVALLGWAGVTAFVVAAILLGREVVELLRENWDRVVGWFS
jgi:hypothetical protein